MRELLVDPGRRASVLEESAAVRDVDDARQDGMPAVPEGRLHPLRECDQRRPGAAALLLRVLQPFMGRHHRRRHPP